MSASGSSCNPYRKQAALHYSISICSAYRLSVIKLSAMTNSCLVGMKCLSSLKRSRILSTRLVRICLAYVIDMDLSKMNGEYIDVCVDFSRAFSLEIRNSSHDWLKTFDLMFAIERISIVALLKTFISFWTWSITISTYCGHRWFKKDSNRYSLCCWRISHRRDLE
jgi:hypothetical protein